MNTNIYILKLIPDVPGKPETDTLLSHHSNGDRNVPPFCLVTPENGWWMLFNDPSAQFRPFSVLVNRIVCSIYEAKPSILVVYASYDKCSPILTPPCYSLPVPTALVNLMDIPPCRLDKWLWPGGLGIPCQRCGQDLFGGGGGIISMGKVIMQCTKWQGGVEDKWKSDNS